ncbi:DUF1295 domain-containing protein [Halioglobus sp. HI00S01]|uniref:DUF1295 domain-containing protein n=1 Tax=Halioglobus sp. HI00S01 TaxID=1822214 RepID=UPI001E5F10C8|nr:DUF1295 domain-containing protein [Halioglobus sp. HI00S01]
MVVIGVIVLAMSEHLNIRTLAVSAIYLFIGLRMVFFALRMWRDGHIDVELPRYKYQQRRWEKAGITNIPLIRQVEVLVQALANASFLALPAFVMWLNPYPAIHPLEWVALLLWIAAFAMESVADMQKKAFIKRPQASGDNLAVCNVGLWRYSRHPNYFAEWMV